MQYKIPQNVRIADKIVGPLTLKQMVIVGIGGGFTYVIYNVLAKRYYIEVWLPAIIPPGLLTLALAFLKINGIEFGKWCLLMVEFFKNPRKRTFVMGSADNHHYRLFAEKKKKAQTKTEDPEKESKRAKIREISKLVDDYSPKQPKTHA